MADTIDTDPTRLAARTLIEQLRGTLYNDDNAPAVPIPPQRTWWRYALDDEQAIAAVLAFAHEAIARHDRQLATQKARGAR